MADDTTRRGFLKGIATYSVIATGAGAAGWRAHGWWRDSRQADILRDVARQTDDYSANRFDVLKELYRVIRRYPDYIDEQDPLIRSMADEVTIDFEAGEIIYPDAVSFRYAKDVEQFGSVEHWLAPPEYIENGYRGDCEDNAFFTASLLEAKGLPTRIVGGAVKNPDFEEYPDDWVGHALVETYADGEYYVIDVSAPDVIAPRDEFPFGPRASWEPMIMFGDTRPPAPYEYEWFSTKWYLIDAFVDQLESCLISR